MVKVRVGAGTQYTKDVTGLDATGGGGSEESIIAVLTIVAGQAELTIPVHVNA